jgi:formylglycine-generating enzyme required for sulfatase activity
MTLRNKALVSIAIILTFIVGCGGAAPTNTPVPSADASIPPVSSPLPQTEPAAADVQPSHTPASTSLQGGGETWTRPTDGMVMVYVPAGTFSMGSTDAQVDDALARCRESYNYCNRSFYGLESPQHTVTLDSFWLDQTEVTNAQYHYCVKAGVCQAPTTCGKGEPTFDDASKAKHPVICVDWYGAEAYCEWAGARLPTEAEWEYAARGPEDHVYPWDNEPGGSSQNYCDASCTESWADQQADDGYAQTAPVGSYPDGASWCGALDLAGNVYEWVADWQNEYPSTAQTNPTGPAEGSNKVARSSSWYSFQDRARAAARNHIAPEESFDHTGFRCARDTGTASSTATLPTGTGNVKRIHLTYDELMNGFEATSPVDDSAFTMPDEAAPPTHVFEGRLELLGEKDSGQIQVLRGELGQEYAHLPEFDYEFVQSDGYLVPIRRGQIITEDPNWNYILEPGRIWQESGDRGYSRASLPFALVIKGGNAAFNGVMTFLFDGQNVSKVWYQITQETTSYTRANFWGFLDAAYHPGVTDNVDQVRADFSAELAARFPTKPIEQLAVDYPGVDVTAFGRGVSPEHMTWYGLVVGGVNYVGGCRTRFGQYAYCESMRATSYSTAKSAFVSVALMRLAQKYGPEVTDLLIKDYVPEYTTSPGDWSRVTFNNTLDMATGNYRSTGHMADEDSDKMGQYFNAQPYTERIALAFDWPHSAEPGETWVYRTSDTFILTRAMHNYLQSQQGPDADIYQFVVDEVYRPLGLGPGAFTTMRTADDGWQGQPEGGFGLWWVPDDVAKIAILLNSGGAIDGEQILHPALLAAAMQQDPDDRGVDIGHNWKYNNAFWAQKYGPADGFDCEFWIPTMQGVSGNVVALFPNGVTYYYFSDNQQFTWDAAVRETDKIAPHCP